MQAFPFFFYLSKDQSGGVGGWVGGWGWCISCLKVKQLEEAGATAVIE